MSGPFWTAGAEPNVAQLPHVFVAFPTDCENCMILFKMQAPEKVFAPFLISSVTACLSHRMVSDLKAKGYF